MAAFGIKFSGHGLWVVGNYWGPMGGGQGWGAQGGPHQRAFLGPKRS